MPTLAVSVIFGAGAGIVGTLLVMAYVAPAPAVTGTPLSILRDRARAPAAGEAPQIAEAASRAMVLLFNAKTQTHADPVVSSYIPTEAIGAGMVLTSDGWILGHVPSTKGKKPVALAAVVGGRAYDVASAVRDPYSGVSFMKIEAANLPVTAFGDGLDLSPGDALFAYDAGGGLRRLGLLAHEGPPAHAPVELVRSTESIQRMLRVDGATLPSGSMVLDREGKVVGVYLGGDGFGAAVVPFGAFSRVIGGVLRDGKPARPFLGAYYVDLSELLGVTGDLPQRGALLSASPDGKLAAVMRRSPADRAGLAAGDIVVSVDGVQVTPKNPFADLVAEYAPGEIVTLTVARGEEERQVEVTLGASPLE